MLLLVLQNRYSGRVYLRNMCALSREVLQKGFLDSIGNVLLEKRLCLVVGNLHSHLVRLRLLVDPVQLVILLVHLIIAIVGTIDDNRLMIID